MNKFVKKWQERREKSKKRKTASEYAQIAPYMVRYCSLFINPYLKEKGRFARFSI